MPTRGKKQQDPIPSMEVEEPSHLSPPKRRGNLKATQLQIAEGKRDLDTLRAVVRRWVAPLLVKEFIAEYDAARSKTEVNSRNELPNPWLEGAEMNRIY